jgi:hypothetical protein
MELAITNVSFEIPPLAEEELRVGAPLGWTGSGTIGIMNPPDSYFAGTTDSNPGPSPIDGRNAAFINYGGQLVYEDSNLVAQPNGVYKLTLLAGQRSGVDFGSGSVNLWAGTNLLTQGFPNPPAGTFIALSLSYTSPPAGAMLGKPLRIEINAPTPNSQVWFDNVHLLSEDPTCTPHKARAVAQLFNGIFVGATMVDRGCGYTNVPLVTIQGGGGNGATATVLLIDGRVLEIRVTNGGCCYTNPPTIVIESPPQMPTLTIRVSKVIVTQNITRGERYVLESSFDLITWTATGPPFTATGETVEEEFDINVNGRFFRIRRVPLQ